MSIVKEWEGREKVYIPTCDVCGAQLSPQYSFMDAVKLRRAAGWKTKRIGKDYVDICDECLMMESNEGRREYIVPLSEDEAFYGFKDVAVPLIRCKDCKWFGALGCAIRIVDDTDKPSENDYCSFAERKEE